MCEIDRVYAVVEEAGPNDPFPAMRSVWAGPDSDKAYRSACDEAARLNAEEGDGKCPFVVLKWQANEPEGACWWQDDH